MNFIEEIQTFNGPICFCFLCGEHLKVDEKLAHCREECHKVLYEYECSDAYSVDDKLIMVKSESLAPTEVEFTAVKNMVLTCEKTLKLVSDMFMENSISEPENKDCIKKTSNESIYSTQKINDTSDDKNKDSKEEDKFKNSMNAEHEANLLENLNDNKDKKENVSPTIEEKDHSTTVPIMTTDRQIKGSVRVGLLGNGLLMLGEVKVKVIVVSDDKPTVSMLKKLHQYFVQEIQKVTTDNYNVTLDEGECCILVEPLNRDVQGASCTLSLTSAKVRRHPFNLFNASIPSDPNDMLPRSHCEQDLQAIRRARWFETKMFLLNHCEVVFRIIRDLCRRDLTFGLINDWLLQQLLFKVLSSSDGVQMSVSEAVYRFFECISSGALLQDAPGFYDPCERVPINLSNELSDQSKEDITSKAQEILRRISQKRLYEILEIPDQFMNAKVKEVIRVLKERKRS